MRIKGRCDNDGVGSCSQAILEVEGYLPEASLRESLDKIAVRFPLIHGRIGIG